MYHVLAINPIDLLHMPTFKEKRKTKLMYLLAIETSCDETAAAILAFTPTTKKRKTNENINDFKLCSSVVSSQVKLHAKYGGVVPMLAAREQLRNIEPVIGESLKSAHLALGDMDYFAVTYGPGLIPSLHVGVNYARAIAFAMRKPLIGINHLEGHIYSNWLAPFEVNSKLHLTKQKFLHNVNSNRKSYKLKAISFPILNLIVSGGHTELVLMKRHGMYEIIGKRSTMLPEKRSTRSRA